MARKTVLTKRQIIDCAFDLCKKEGLSNITIRNIAASLKTSTAPIYTQYKNRDAILQGLDETISNKLLESMRLPRNVSGFLNIGVGIVDFTIKYKSIVSEFYFTTHRLNFDITSSMDGFVKDMQKDPFLSLLTYETLYGLLEDMKVYTFGLVALICTETEKCDDINYYQKLLSDTGDKLINYHLAAAGQMKACEALMTEDKLKACVKEKV